jgi:hypothetical protein
MSVRITCINKDGGNHYNPHEAISHLGWVNESTGGTGKSTRLAMYDWIESGGEAYVKDAYGNTAKVGTAETETGTKYVRTYSNSQWTDNLLALMECT